MTEEISQPKRRGRPPTGVTPKRDIRIKDSTWDEMERLALELGRRDGKIRLVKDRVTGRLVERGDHAAYVDEALRRENARIDRQLRR
jgi:hypothetical protein